MKNVKPTWETPKLTVYGDVATITQQSKNKTFGAGDDVILNNQAILTNAS